ncbi:hypothetical protein Lal_00000076 [Lupinus albus]|uniref:Uncharacterized protein n=1 Tax=Lupinus albus TaxID=3870 RepID=A0A6A5LLP0_LUPAL|nr:hypothetical protein Lalb_Chr21g0308921 [Lupinus albus]KAF1860663.1 hypothetical protein Lal_00000076 [Lupinus albus]
MVGGSHGCRKFFLNLSMFLIMFFVVVPFSHASFWNELVHPKFPVRITSRIQGIVHVKCISSEGDIIEASLDGSKADSSLSFEVELKFLTTIRYNCLLRIHGSEIGQFLAFRSGSYCVKGCYWELHSHYARRLSSLTSDFVNQIYKPIGSPDDRNYDFS